MCDDFNLIFNEREMEAYLEAWGYVIKTEKRQFWRSAYHDEVEEYTAPCKMVFKGGKEVVQDQHSYQYGRAVRNVFAAEFKQRLFTILSAKNPVTVSS